MHSYDDRHSPLNERTKEWAALDATPGARIIHISRAELGRTYYHPLSNRPMHARVNHPTCPSFYYKGDYSELEFPISPYERPRAETFVHLHIIRELLQRTSITITDEDKKLDVTISGVKKEVCPAPPFDMWRFDAAAQVRGPKELRNRFNLRLAFEVICTHEIHKEKEDSLRELPYAVAVIRPYSKMLKEITREDFENRSVPDADRWRWEQDTLKRIRGFLNIGNRSFLFHVPGEERGIGRVTSPGFNADSAPEKEDADLSSLAFPQRTGSDLPSATESTTAVKSTPLETEAAINIQDTHSLPRTSENLHLTEEKEVVPVDQGPLLRIIKKIQSWVVSWGE